eukprot:Platyproteum_vivax@DN733_c0_g1_i1.p1
MEVQSAVLEQPSSEISLDEIAQTDGWKNLVNFTTMLTSKLKRQEFQMISVGCNILQTTIQRYRNGIVKEAWVEIQQGLDEKNSTQPPINPKNECDELLPALEKLKKLQTDFDVAWFGPLSPNPCKVVAKKLN